MRKQANKKHLNCICTLETVSWLTLKDSLPWTAETKEGEKQNKIRLTPKTYCNKIFCDSVYHFG